MSMKNKIFLFEISIIYFIQFVNSKKNKSAMNADLFNMLLTI